MSGEVQSGIYDSENIPDSESFGLTRKETMSGILMGYYLSGGSEDVLLEYYPIHSRPYTVSLCNQDGYRRTARFKKIDSALERLRATSAQRICC